MRLKGSVADFVVWTDDPLFRDRLLHMGWRIAADGSLSRGLPSTDDTPRIFSNFKRHLKAMILQSARAAPIPWDALEVFLVRVQDVRLDWWLYGSGGLAVRGINIVPGDLDFAVNDPHLTAAVLRDLLVEPVTHHRKWVAEWSGRAFAGALLEWVADARPTGRPEPTTQESAMRRHLEDVDWRGWRLKVPRCEPS